MDDENEIKIYCEGVFDLLHVGHIDFIKRAKACGDFLIVGIHSDEDVASYKRKPILPFEQRYEIIKHCSLIDEVIEDAPLFRFMSQSEVKQFLLKYDIDIIVHGDDAKCYPPHLAEIIPIEYVKYTNSTSTTKIIEKILQHHGETV